MSLASESLVAVSAATVARKRRVFLAASVGTPGYWRAVEACARAVRDWIGAGGRLQAVPK